MKKIVISIILLVFIIIIGVTTFFFAKFNHVKIDKSDEALGISTKNLVNLDNNSNIVNSIDMSGKNTIESTPTNDSEKTETEEPEYEKINNVINIALFGIDSRNTSKQGRSDSMIIATIDFEHKKVKLSSLMRDMYVSIDGHGKTKLNHSYAYGGPQLTIKTINQNFGTDIRDYVTVDFFTLEKIIDIVGGVEIDVKQNEISMLNGLMNEVAGIQKVSPKHITKSGLQVLNGKQAVAYSRIRYVGNGDFERTERQKRVLTAMIEKFETQIKDITTLPKMINEILPLIETSLDFQTILNLGINYLKNPDIEIEQSRFPVDGYWHNDMSTGTYYLKFEEEITKQQIIDYIFKDIKPEEK